MNVIESVVSIALTRERHCSDHCQALAATARSRDEDVTDKLTELQDREAALESNQAYLNISLAEKEQVLEERLRECRTSRYSRVFSCAQSCPCLPLHMGYLVNRLIKACTRIDWMALSRLFR